MAVKVVQAIINGITTNLTLNSSTGKYEATVTAPTISSYGINDGHYYPVTIKATDEAGNRTYMAKMLFTVDSSMLFIHVEEFPFFARSFQIFSRLEL